MTDLLVYGGIAVAAAFGWAFITWIESPPKKPEPNYKKMYEDERIVHEHTKERLKVVEVKYAQIRGFVRHVGQRIARHYGDE